MASLDLSRDVVSLTADVCDIESVSGNERELADGVEAALRTLPHLRVERDGDAVVARTELGRSERVVIAGHLDTVPLAAGSLPTRLADDVLHGRGSVDMKGGVAVALRLAATVPAPSRDVSFIFYDHEEVASTLNGLGRLARTNPEWLDGNFAILMEPSDGVVEGGCNGTLRVQVTLRGETAHSARAWMGHNAIHDAAEVLQRLKNYSPKTVTVDGLDYRESLNAVLIDGGISGNVIPDRCVVTVNYRFAPDKTVEQAAAHVVELFEGFEVTLTDSAPGARPGLDLPAAAAFVQAIGGEPKPKYGWTDVARFSALGVPAVNYGPGDPLLAHKDDERVPVSQLVDCEQRLRAWLEAPAE